MVIYFDVSDLGIYYYVKDLVKNKCFVIGIVCLKYH